MFLWTWVHADVRPQGCLVAAGKKPAIKSINGKPISMNPEWVGFRAHLGLTLVPRDACSDPWGSAKPGWKSPSEHTPRSLPPRRVVAQGQPCLCPVRYWPQGNADSGYTSVLPHSGKGALSTPRSLSRLWAAGCGFVNGAHCGSLEPRLPEPAPPALPRGGRLVTPQPASGQSYSHYAGFSSCLQTWLLINPFAVSRWNRAQGFGPVCSERLWMSCKQGIIWGRLRYTDLGQAGCRGHCRWPSRAEPFEEWTLVCGPWRLKAQLRIPGVECHLRGKTGSWDDMALVSTGGWHTCFSTLPTGPSGMAFHWEFPYSHSTPVWEAYLYPLG